MDNLDRLVSFDIIIIFTLLSFATHRAVNGWKVTRIKPFLIISGPFVVCTVTIFRTCVGIKDDPRRNALIMLCILLATRSTIVVYILLMGFNAVVGRPQRLGKILFGGFANNFYLHVKTKYPTSHPPRKLIKLLTTEIASSRDHAAHSWLASKVTRFQHWTILADGQCYELGRSRKSKSGAGFLYEPRIQPYDEWKVHRGLTTQGMTIKLDTYYVGKTVLSHTQISERAHTIWSREFNSQYDLTSQNCQDFCDKLVRGIHYSHEGEHGLGELLKRSDGPRKLSTSYFRANLLVKTPFLLNKWLTKYMIRPAYYRWSSGSVRAGDLNADRMDNLNSENTIGQDPSRCQIEFLDGAVENICTVGEGLVAIQEKEIMT